MSGPMYLRRQRCVEHLHALGARATFEFIAEIDRAHGIGADIDRRLDRYARLDAEILAAVGGDRFPASPIRRVSQ